MEHSVQPDLPQKEQQQEAQFLANRRKSRIGLILIISAFVIPAILAKLALDGQWLNVGVTNYGQIPSQEITLSQLTIDPTLAPDSWLILVPLNQCQNHCQALIDAISNTRTAIGREMHRVTPLALTTDNQAKFSSLWLQQPLNDSFTELTPPNHILIADPLGRIVMQYPIANDDLVALGQAIVADMKKLLKYSQIG